MRRGDARVVTCATFVLFALLACGCAVPVAAALDEPDANRVVVALDQSGIDASKEVDPTAEGKFRVVVARDDVGRALSTMHDEELPRAKTRGVLDATDRGQLVPSQAAEHAQLVAGLAGELERTLGGIDGVLSARVHLNLPPREPLRDGPPAKATASVLIEHRGTTPPLAPESIQRLVAGGAPGVLAADVAVIFLPHTMRAGGGRSELSHVGPIAVARGSANTLKLAFAGAALLVVLLAGAALAMWARIGRMRREREIELASRPAPIAAQPSPQSQSHPSQMVPQQPQPRSVHPSMGPRQ